MTPTIRTDLSDLDYYNDPCVTPSLSQSIAHTLISESPLHAWLRHPRLGGMPRKPTAEMKKGTLIHSLLLDNGKDLQLCNYPDWRTKKSQEDRAQALTVGKVPVLPKQIEEVLDAVAAIKTQLDDRGLSLNGAGQCEAMVVWEEQTDEGTPVLCRGKLDHWLSPRITDLKTIQQAHPRVIAAHMVKYGYAIQAAAYRSAVAKVHPELAGRVDFVFAFAEIEPPYCVTLARPSGTMRELGERQWRRAVNEWERCLRLGKWPSYTEGIIDVEAPAWALTQAEEDYYNGSTATEIL